MVDSLEKSVSKLWDNRFARFIERVIDKYFPTDPKKKSHPRYPSSINSGSGGRGAYQDENSF